MGCISSKAKAQSPIQYTAVPEHVVENDVEHGGAEPQVVIEEETEIMTCCWTGNMMASDLNQQHTSASAVESADVIAEETGETEAVEENKQNEEEILLTSDDVQKDAGDEVELEQEFQNVSNGQICQNGEVQSRVTGSEPAQEGEPETAVEAKENGTANDGPGLLGLCKWC